ncbi:OprO/OprP family phosphate-selective porin [Sphingomonas abietis]|uniref:Porin n=1 Tax=Sphingomonas abietis TaxID=3012344 RepID=A0ABY7NR55_9SPHN|nr:porin [Sphingomonas abietis]WBO22424.1 porin [Sphingomonas abietis]
MRNLLLGGVSFMALAASPALAAKPASNAAILERLNALEARVDALQAENADLHRQVDAQRTSVATIPAQIDTAVARAAPQIAQAPARAASSGGADTAKPNMTAGTSWTIVPQFNSPDGNFTFKPRGLVDVDYAAFTERKGGYDYNNGTQIRRGRFGFDGSMFRQFAWRLEGEWVGGQASLLDAYVAYTGVKNFTLVLGQLKIPAGLEANSADAFNEFLERGMANTAFGAVGGERRVGVTVAYADRLITATGGFYGANESISRNATTPDEVWGYNGRVTIEPINDPRHLIHVGASAYHVKDLAGNSVTLADRPNVRVDNGNIESVTITGTNPAGGPQTGVSNATFYGFEGAGVYGPFSVQGEYSHMRLDRFGAAPSLNFDGWYAFGSILLTGEARSFKGGVIDRLRPIRSFDPAKGNWGAFELALRYDRLNLTDHRLSPLDHDAHAWTAAMNWYLTGNMKVLFNYIRFEGQNSPLVVAPVSLNGTTAKGDAFATRLHLDF